MSVTLKQLLAKNKLVIAPGVFDGLSAKLAEKAGFSAIYASGGAVARSTGQPDIGLLSLAEVVQRVAQITRVTTIPVIADADTGFGNEWNTQLTVAEFERAGAQAIHIEDQEFPKRCGHLSGKKLISTEEMCIKLRAAVAARKNPDFLIIARTDAIAVEGFAAAIVRAKAYANTGIDIIFIEAPETIEQIQTIAASISMPKLINMFVGGKTPLLPAKELEKMGYQLMIIPSDLQRAAIKAMQKTLSVIWEHGDSLSIDNELTSFKEREEIVETAKYFQLTEQLQKK